MLVFEVETILSALLPRYIYIFFGHFDTFLWSSSLNLSIDELILGVWPIQKPKPWPISDILEDKPGSSSVGKTEINLALKTSQYWNELADRRSNWTDAFLPENALIAFSHRSHTSIQVSRGFQQPSNTFQSKPLGWLLFLKGSTILNWKLYFFHQSCR